MLRRHRILKSGLYQKSLKRVSRWPSFSLDELNAAVNLLAEGAALPPEYRDHALKGNFSGLRECHIRSDLLLIYRKTETELIIILINIGSHSSLFGK